jgi:hypothetical protein
LHKGFLVLSALAFVALPASALAEDLTFQLTNGSSQPIVDFYTGPASEDTWADDLFGDKVFPPGNTVPVTIADGSDQCVYDMKFVTEDGKEFVESGIDLCALAGGEYTLTDAE